MGDPLRDPVEAALAYLHTPYVWGGRCSFGLDCSSLVQNALQATGHPCLRDAYMQQDQVGEPVAGTGFLRGDLLYWKGHVGMMSDPETLLHANAYHMAVALEPVETVLNRIQKTAGPVLTVRRLLS